MIEKNHGPFIPAMMSSDEQGTGLSRPQNGVGKHKIKTQKVKLSCNNSSSHKEKCTNKSHRFARAFACTGLALMIGAGTILGLTLPVANASSLNSTATNACGGSSAMSADQNFATQGGGLITPRADDPVLFETKNGLQIKFGLDNASGTGGSETYPTLSSGNLSGFPYFTTTENGTTYTWVIIGRSSSSSLFTRTMAQWQDYNFSPTYNYFFNNCYETSSPAGSAINSESSKEYAVRNVLGFSNVVVNYEIPENCVLVLLNGIVESGPYGGNVVGSYRSIGAASYTRCWWAVYNGNQLCVAMNGYYTNGSLGLNSIKSYIRSVTITTHECVNGDNPNWRQYLRFVNTDQSSYVFPLAFNVDGGNFKWSTYLSANQMKLSSNQWLRGTDSEGAHNAITYADHSYDDYWQHAGYLNTSGAQANQNLTTNAGYRPAFVMSMV